VPLRLSIGNRIWQPGWPWVLLTLAACGLFGALGWWQFQRGVARELQWSYFTDARNGVRDTSASELATLRGFTRVRLRGRYDGARQFLLENISEGGRVGYYVLTPLLPADGPAVLVNRGFVAGSGYREQLPDIALPPDTMLRTVTGRAGVLPVAGLAAGRMAPPATGSWPRVASFPRHQDLAATLPYALADGVLLLEEDGGPELVRNWSPPGLEPVRHYAYAVQWWAFAVLAVVLLVALNLRRKTS
jgi:cytochrome oxidase assembly protein ShyY1